MPMDMDIFTLFGLFVMMAITIYIVLKILWTCLKFAHWCIGMAFYFLIWVFAPKTWREMHDA